MSQSRSPGAFVTLNVSKHEFAFTFAEGVVRGEYLPQQEGSIFHQVKRSMRARCGIWKGFDGDGVEIEDGFSNIIQLE